MRTHASRVALGLTLGLLCLAACSKSKEAPAPSAAPTSDGSAPAAAAKPQGPLTVGLVTDVGGRGDQSFNDSALRGLELWGAGQVYAGGSYRKATPEELQASLPEGLPPVTPIPGLKPLPLQSKAQEDYEPNLNLLVDQGAQLVVGVGYLLEPAVEAAAREHKDTKFLLIDSPVLDAAGQPTRLPNVRTVTFREEEGSFLVGALAGLVTKTGKVGFVGGIEVPLIKKFEAGFRAGVAATNPKAAAQVLVLYTGNFDNVSAGKQVGQNLLARGVDVLFHAAGTSGLGAIQAVKEARAAGRGAWAVGVDSDQHHVAPDAVLTSMVKRVDLAVYQAAKDLAEGRFEAGDVALGLEQGGVSLAPVRVDFPGKADVLARVDALRAEVAAGRRVVPATMEALRASGAPGAADAGAPKAP